MPRQATTPRPREEKHQNPTSSQADVSDSDLHVIDLDGDTLAALTDSDDDIAFQPESASPPAHGKRRGSGVLTLVVLALLGMAVGFTVVMLL